MRYYKGLRFDGIRNWVSRQGWLWLHYHDLCQSPFPQQGPWPMAHHGYYGLWIMEDAITKDRIIFHFAAFRSVKNGPRIMWSGLYAVCCMLYGMRQQTTVCCKPAGRHSFISQIVQVSFFHKIVWWVPSRHPITTSRGRKWKRRQSRKREEEKRGISFQAQQKRREDEAFKTLGKSSNLDPWSLLTSLVHMEATWGIKYGTCMWKSAGMYQSYCCTSNAACCYCQ